MMQKIVNSVDLYGEKVGVNFKGQSTYNTKMGALVSLALFFLISTYSIIKVIAVLQRSEPTKQYFVESANLYLGD
jgi:hypothetical protein